MPANIQHRLIKTLRLLQIIRNIHGGSLIVNSTYRAGMGGAHGEGRAIDFQPPRNTDKDWGHNIIENLQTMHDNGELLALIGAFGCRVIWEWNNKNYGWFHIDTERRVSQGQVKFLIMYPKNGEMQMAVYDGRAPWQYPPR